MTYDIWSGIAIVNESSKCVFCNKLLINLTDPKHFRIKKKYGCAQRSQLTALSAHSSGEPSKDELVEVRDPVWALPMIFSIHFFPLLTSELDNSSLS